MSRLDAWLLVILSGSVGALAASGNLHLLWTLPADVFVYGLRAAQGR